MPIPFVAQQNLPDWRDCGAAALVMVLRSLDISTELTTIRHDLRLLEPGNSVRTFRLAQIAILHGLAAMPVRLADPWRFLTSDPSLFHAVRVVINHRIRSDSPLGHYSVFLDADPIAETVRIHDPQLGPERVLSKAELLTLWTPLGGPMKDEITGSVAALFTESGIMAVRTCPKCDRVAEESPVLRWYSSEFSAIFCPWCDSKYTANQ